MARARSLKVNQADARDADATRAVSSPASLDPASLGPAKTTLDALAVLARRGAVAELLLAPDGCRMVAVRFDASMAREPSPVPSRPGCEPTRRGLRRDSLPYALFRDARDAGWLVPVDSEHVRWVLSRAARQLLRRQKSAGDGAASASAPPTSLQALLPELPTAPHVDAGESPLGWLRRHKDKAGRPLISAMQLEAGERFRSELWRAEMTPRVTIDWSKIGGGGMGSSQRRAGACAADIRDSAAAAAQRVRRALGAVGPVSAGLLIDVCGHLIGIEEIERRRGWPVRSGKVALQIALSELARHYRLPGTEAYDAEIATRLRAWHDHTAR